jgi:hypothetical protein
LAKKDIGKIVDGHAEQHHALKKGHSLQLLFHIPRFDDADSEVGSYAITMAHVTCHVMSYGCCVVPI